MRESGFWPLRETVKLRDSTMRDTVEAGLPGACVNMPG
jgi:hypothetical protein